MREGVEVVGLAERERWQVLTQDAAPSQHWRYAFGLQASGIEPQLVRVTAGASQLQMVIHEREWCDSRDIATIACLSGASLRGDPAPVLRTWRDYAERQRWLSGYLQLEPYTDVEPDVAAPDTTASHNSVFLLDLAADPDLRGASRTIQRKLRTAQQNGATLCEDGAALQDALCRLYPETAQQLGIVTHPPLSSATLQHWASGEFSLLLGAELEGRIVAVYLFLMGGGVAESQVLAYTDSGRELTAWLIGHGAQRLAARGVSTLNLGGGVRPGDGIFQFKAKFSGQLRPLRSIRQIYDTERYAALCRAAGVDGANPERFPAYRQAAAASMR